MNVLRITSLAIVAALWLVLNSLTGFVQADISQSQTPLPPTYVWHTFYGDESLVGGIATDSHGNVYVSGQSRATWKGDGGANPLHEFSGEVDAFILKLDRNGGYLWHTFYGSVDLDTGGGITTDAADNVYVTGSARTSWNGNGGVSPLHPHSASNAQPGLNLFCLKLNSAGAYQWHTFYGPTEAYGGGAIQINSYGDITIDASSGQSWLGENNTSPLHAHTLGSDVGIPQPDIFVLQLNSDGAYRWHTFYGATASLDEGGGMALDHDGAIYVTGRSHNAWQGDGGAAPLHMGGGLYDIFVLKLNHNGAYNWHTFYGIYGSQEGSGITLDDDNNVYLTGTTFTAWKGDGGTNPLHGFTGAADMFVLKLSSNGAYRWHTFYGAPSLDQGFSIASVSDGIAVVGYSDSSWQGDPTHPPLHPYNPIYESHNISILKLDAQGGYQWNTFYGDDSIGWGITADVDGNLLFGGSGGDWKGDNGHDPLHSGGSFAVLKLGYRSDVSPPQVQLAKTGQDQVKHPFLRLTAQDADSGIAKIQIAKSENADTEIVAFSPGATSPIRITATVTKLSKPSTLRVRATNGAGGVTVGDVVLQQLAIVDGKRVEQSFDKLAPALHRVTIFNGKPGFSRLNVRVNGALFKIVELQEGMSQTIDISAAMTLSANTVTFVGAGARGDCALIVIGDSAVGEPSN